MLGILFLILACFVGHNLLKKVLPGLFNVSKTKSLFGKTVKLDNWMVTLPASFLAGTLIMTWITYLMAYAFYRTGNPMLYGNMASMLFFLVLSVYLILSNKKSYARFFDNIKSIRTSQCYNFYAKHRLELMLILVTVIISSYIMFLTFNVRNGNMYIGLSVFSDFGPHLAIIRSFSYGANFPTQYPHFADGHIRYHFLFQFLAGNLEFLGMRIDWAFNLPSILSLVSLVMLFYSFSVILTGEKGIGILATLLIFFRSSFAFFTYVADMKTSSLGQIILNIFRTNQHIGNTRNANWGLWSPWNLYVNQRHFAFSFAILLLILIILLPIFNKMVINLKKAKIAAQKEVEGKTLYVEYWVKEFILKKDAWLPADIKRSVVIGVILGLIAFWNGAVMLGGLAILFVMALFSKHRLEYLNIAIIVMSLSFLETNFFFGQGNSAVKPQLFIGFLAEPRSIFGISKYYIELWGILPVVFIAGLFTSPKGGRWLSLSFFAPWILGNTLLLTPDIVVNHKYIYMTVYLIDIITASFLYFLFISKKAIRITISVIILFTMTITGVVDYISICNMNNNNRSVVIKVDDPLLLWAQKNTAPDEIFLTDMFSLHPILLAGRKIFYGWPYFTWSAGYSTGAREPIIGEIYGGTNISEVKQLVKSNNIRYIVIDDGIRNSQAFKLNESLINNNFKLVYDDKVARIEIYKTY